MKISEQWLREWIGSDITRETFCERLTMAGLELESIQPVAGDFSGIFVAEVLAVEKHPQADRLRVCMVKVSEIETVTIVCGAPNVVAGMKAALARPGAVLPDGMKIKAAKLRGILSDGMLCSARELGMSSEHEGLLVLPIDAPLGADVREYLQLNDHIIEVSITPNRGDCLSVAGLAQEIAALTNIPLNIPKITTIATRSDDKFPVEIKETEHCPRYAARSIKNINPAATSPIWLQERLRRSGIRSIHPVVDVTNYVMLEWGQPMHAFDLAKLNGGIAVRMATTGETIELLDGRTVTLNNETLVIADHAAPVAIAGVMGGVASSVTASTTDILLESAWFSPTTVAKSARHYQVHSESSHRFERNINPELQEQALVRATALIQQIVGGTASAIIDKIDTNHWPDAREINLRAMRLKQISGMDIPFASVEKILAALGFAVMTTAEGWHVTVPARRADIHAEIDLIEEVLRVYGYEKIEAIPTTAQLKVQTREIRLASELPRVLMQLGYHEVITYSFIAPKLQQLFNPEINALSLVNPISADMAVMRTSLWPGLVNVLQHNVNRQQTRVRIFEIGHQYIDGKEQNVLAGLLTGNAEPLQWGSPERTIDFMDAKGDVETLLINLGLTVEFRKTAQPALHPGQAADIYTIEGRHIGTLGALHPAVLQTLAIEGAVLVFSLQLDSLAQLTANPPQYQEISRFPANRRDIAILVDASIQAAKIQATIEQAGGEWLQDVTLFDLWQGKGVPAGKKSMAFALTLQHTARTLTDEEIATQMKSIIMSLQTEFSAELRN